VTIGQAAVIGVIASLGCGHLAAQGRAGARRFTLSGTVVDGGNQPMAGVEVSLGARDRELTVEPATADAQGHFAFGGLTAGDYILSAEGGFGTVFYGQMPDPFNLSSISVGGENGDKSVVFRIVPRGVIEGTIRDEFGDPMVRVNVSMTRPVWRDGRTTMAQLGTKSTDDRGRYRFGNLAPGSYVVCIDGGQNAAAPVPGPVDYAARVDSRTYARTCNRVFQLSPGQRAQVDLTPLAAPTVTVRGHVRNAPAQTGFSVNLISEDDNLVHGGVTNAFVDGAQGTFTIRGVLPGRYRLRAQTYSNTPAQKPLVAEVPLDVGGSDVEGVDVALDSQAVVDVALHGMSQDRIDHVRVTLRSSDPDGAFRGNVQTMDGAFQLQPVSPVSYRLSLQTPAESCVESVKLAGHEIRGASFDVAAGAALHIDVAITQNCGSVHLRAVREGAAVARARVVLLRSGTAKDPGDLSEDYTNDEGEFTFSGLTPGRYLVWAWAVEGQGAIAGPSSLAAVEQQATVVDVKAGDPTKVDVPLLAAEGTGQ
jgi:protocatechuate 3,4-dioxygenase beta subunit